jgi:2'-5' RNA ligase
MRAIVSVLDDSSRVLVEHLWAGIEREFGIEPPYTQPVPHFTYHVAETYAPERLHAVLREVAARHGPFQVRAGGLGLFTGKKLVLHVPLVRNSAMNRIQRDLWGSLEGAGEAVVHHFHPELWIPHVTLAYHGLTDVLLPDVVRWLAERSFAWEVKVDHLAVIEEHGAAPVEPIPLSGAVSQLP